MVLLCSRLLCSVVLLAEGLALALNVGRRHLHGLHWLRAHPRRLVIICIPLLLVVAAARGLLVRGAMVIVVVVVVVCLTRPPSPLVIIPVALALSRGPCICCMPLFMGLPAVLQATAVAKGGGVLLVRVRIS